MQTGRADRKRYAEDKPKGCAYCYYWNKKKSCCMKSECYYLLVGEGNVQAITSEGEADCGSCPYGRHSPCIGYCLQKIVQEMKRKKQGRGKEGGHHAG